MHRVQLGALLFIVICASILCGAPPKPAFATGDPAKMHARAVAAFVRAAGKGDSVKVKAYLDAGGAIEAMADDDGWHHGALIGAVHHGQLAMVELLLGRGASIADTNLLAVAFGAEKASPAVTELLLSRGAPTSRQSLLRDAAKAGKVPASVIALLLKSGCDPNLQEETQTLATMDGHPAYVEGRPADWAHAPTGDGFTVYLNGSAWCPWVC